MKEAGLLERGIESLAALLGEDWTVTQRPQRDASVFDALLEVRPVGDSAYTQLMVDVKQRLTPRQADTVLAAKAALLREVNNYSNLMIVAPWLSAATQKVLSEHGISYLDLTGNIALRVARPAIVIRMVGATRAPRSEAAERSKTTLAGAKAGRLVRLLADVAPPHRATDLHRATELSLPYVSRLLDALEDELLIRRDGRLIRDVQWEGVLRARAAESPLLARNSYTGVLAPNGVPMLLDQISDLAEVEPAVFEGLAVTGTYAASRVAPVAVGGQLMFHVAPWLDIDTLVEDLGLIPVEEGADVLLLRAPDAFVFEGARIIDGLQHVALSQLVLDCLAGPGRMPAEGEAVLRYMSEHLDRWRSSSKRERSAQASF
ncbi:helix-turn-helix domain-containing protein [Streptomyces sp. NPDC059083]|uniref:helix-turn-helix domain-containing protein n=1 Tax=unclassified Streptomyces TaxID=2593676 RepID=UPI0036990340